MHRHRIAAISGVLLCGALLSACGDDPGSPFPQTPNPTPPALAPQVMVLRPNQLTGYVRTDDSTVDAGTLADQESDPSLSTSLQAEGLEVGARATYADPNRGGPPTPFATVISQVLFFRDAQGATAFFADEQKRRNKAPDGGTLSTLSLPLGGADAIVGLAVVVPSQTSGDPPSRALFALIRRGRVIAEVLGGGPQTTATDERFTALVMAQEKQLEQKLSS
jgi:hypothetical protein